MNEGAFTVCPGCGLRLPARDLEPAERYNATGEVVAGQDRCGHCTGTGRLHAVRLARSAARRSMVPTISSFIPA